MVSSDRNIVAFYTHQYNFILEMHSVLIKILEWPTTGLGPRPLDTGQNLPRYDKKIMLCLYHIANEKSKMNSA